MRANNKKILIFIRSDSDRDPKLRDFISYIQDPKTGIITSSYRNIFESKKEVLSSLMKELSKTFKKYHLCIKTSYKDNIHKTDEDTSIESVLESDILDLDPRLGNIKFNLSKDFVERVKIGDIEFSKIGQDSYEITVQVNGCSEKGFVDLLIIDDKNKDLWFPDPNIWDSIQDMGKLKLNHGSLKTTWNFNYKTLEKAKGLFVLVFEDFEGNK